MVKLEFLKRTQTESQPLESESVESDISFEEICPIWSKKLRNGIDEIDRMILVKDSKYCAVGEAWGFSGRHAGYYIAPLIPLIGCWTCVKYGRAMGKISSRKKEYSGNKITDTQLLVANFLKHWNEKHRNITERLRKMRV